MGHAEQASAIVARIEGHRTGREVRAPAAAGTDGRDHVRGERAQDAVQREHQPARVNRIIGAVGLTAADPADLQVQRSDPARWRDLLGVLREMESRLPDAIFVLWDVRTLSFRQFIIDFALKHKLPTSMPLEPYVEAGGLMSYGPNVQSIFRRSAAYVHRILRGAKPADLPVERPSKFDLVVNLKTARKLGLRLPPALLLLADRMIE